VLSNNKAKSQLYAISINRTTGDILWQKDLGDADYNERNTMGACSPVADGSRVYFLLGNSQLRAFDYDGNDVWSKNLNEEFGNIKNDWGYSSSPLIYDGRLYISVVRRRESSPQGSYLLCLEPASGDLVWKKERVTDAIGEAQDSYTSPIPFEPGGKKTVLVAGGDYITCQDAATGTELWRQQHNPRQRTNWRIIPSPVASDSLVFGVVPRGGSAFSIKPGGKTELTLEDSVWMYDEQTTDVSTPLLYDGRLYIVNGMRQRIICIDPSSGSEIWMHQFEDIEMIWASPTAGDGKIYCITQEGEVIVVAASDEFEILSRIQMGGKNCQASIAIAENQLFIRTDDTLYCVASQD
jgi:outer membrane protein assembly factor BamB